MAKFAYIVIAVVWSSVQAASPPVEQLVDVLPTEVHFAPNSVLVNAEGSRTLQRVASDVAAGARVILIPYAFAEGKDSGENEDLARARADAVRRTLISAGAAAANIEVNPVTLVESDDPRAARRVTIVREQIDPGGENYRWSEHVPN